MWGGNEKKDSIDSVRASIDHGVTTIDTAPFYGFGLSEEMIGEAIKSYDRSKVQLLTKFGLVWDGSNNGKGDFFFDADDNGKKVPVFKYSSKENVIKEIEESLKRLQTDYIDLLQIHWPDSTTPISETMEAVETLIQQGKIRAFGVSNYNVSQNVGLWYDIPLDPPLTDKLRFAGGYQNEELAGTDTLSKLLTVGPEWHSKLPSGWQRVISLKYQREEYRLGDDSGLSNLLMPGVSYSFLRSDNRIDPHNGYRLQFDVQVAKEGLVSDTNLLHGNVLLKGLTTLGHNHRLLGRVQFGGSATNGFKNNIPPSLRFFAGGDQSVRGYDYQTLSPKNSDGDRIGGRYLVAGSVEYQYSLTEKWRIATFVDQGNSFNNLELPSLKTGVGFGVRWVSPVGPLRLDLAKALDDEGGIRLHFSMGPEL